MNATLALVNEAIDTTTPLEATINMTPYTIADARRDDAIEDAIAAEMWAEYIARRAQEEEDAL